jgi:hypothetical protein
MPSTRQAFPRQAIPVVLGRASARPSGALTGAFRQASLTSNHYLPFWDIIVLVASRIGFLYCHAS